MAAMHEWTTVTRCPCLVRDSASQDRKRSPTGWWWRFSGLQASAPGNDDGALSGQTGQLSGLQPVPKVVGCGRWRRTEVLDDQDGGRGWQRLHNFIVLQTQSVTRINALYVSVHTKLSSKRPAQSRTVVDV